MEQNPEEKSNLMRTQGKLSKARHSGTLVSIQDTALGVEWRKREYELPLPFTCSL